MGAKLSPLSAIPAVPEVIQPLEALLEQSHLLDALQQGIEQVNLLDVFAIGAREKAHTAFWAWLCDPRGNHQAGDRFLRALLYLFVRRAPRAPTRGWPPLMLLQIESAWLGEAEVTIEKTGDSWPGSDVLVRSLAARRPDLFLGVRAIDGKADAVALVLVEFKIEAEEGENQTRDYAAALDAWCKEKPGLRFPLAVLVAPEEGVAEGMDGDFRFVPLGEMVRVVREVLNDNLRIGLPRTAVDIVDQYVAAVLYGTLSKPREMEEAELVKRHGEALEILRRYLYRDYRVSLQEVARWAGFPETGQPVAFYDRRNDEPTNALLAPVGDDWGIVRCDETRTPIAGGAPSAAAKELGRSTRKSYSGWDHWRVCAPSEHQGKTLGELRQEIHAQPQTDAERLCRAILEGRMEAVKNLLAIVERRELPLLDRQPGARVDAPRTRSDTSLTDLVNAGLLAEDAALFAARGGRQAEGRIVSKEGKVGIEVTVGLETGFFENPSGAAKVALGVTSENGWTAWKIQNPEETAAPRSLDDLRAELGGE